MLEFLLDVVTTAIGFAVGAGVANFIERKAKRPLLVSACVACLLIAIIVGGHGLLGMAPS